MDLYAETRELWSQPAIVAELDVREVVLAGRIVRRLGDDRTCRALMREAERRDPDHPEVRYYTRLRNRRPLSFLETLREHEARRELGTDDPDLEASWRADHAVLLAATRDFTAAHERIAAAREIEESAWVEACHAHVLSLEFRWDEAIERAGVAWEKAPGHHLAARVRADALAATGRLEEAARWLVEFVEATPQSYLVAQLAYHYACTAVERCDDASARPFDRLYERSELIDRLAPLADRETRQSLIATRFEAARLEGRREVLAELARASRVPYFQRIAESIAAHPEGERTVLRHRKIRQRHDTCLPASVVAVASTFDEAVDHDELVEQLTYAGTPIWRIIDWAEARGWRARPFVATAEAAVELIEAGFAFVLTERNFDQSHAIAAVGIDRALGTLILHDPTSERLREMLLDHLGDQFAPVGPHALALAPPARAEALDAIELPSVEFASLNERVARAIFDDAPLSVRSEVEAYLAGDADPALKGWIAARYYLDTRQGERAAAVLRDGLSAHPDCLPLSWLLIYATSTTGDNVLYRETLESIVQRSAVPGTDGATHWVHPEPVLRGRYADMIRLSAEYQPEAKRQLRLALNDAPLAAEINHIHADFLWSCDRHEDSVLPYRVASSLAYENEHYARAYAWALRKQGRPDEGLAWLERRARTLPTGGGGGEAWSTWIDLLEQFGRPDESLARMEEATESRPDDERLAWSAARHFARFGRFQAADRQLAPWAESERAGFYFARSVVSEYRGRYQEALRDAERALELGPGEIAHRNRVLHLVRLVRGALASLDLAREWAASSDGDSEIEDLLLDELRGQDNDERLDRLKRRVERDGLDGWAARELGWSLLGDASRASGRRLGEHLARLRRILERCERISPNVAGTIGLRAEIELLEGDRAASRASFRRAFALDPTYSYGVTRWIDLVVGDASGPEIVRTITDAFSTLDRDLSAARTVALHLAGAIGRETALMAAERWMEISPGDPEPFEAWADVHLERNAGRAELEAMLPRLEEMVGRYPLHFGLGHSLARAYHALTRFEDAISQYRRVLRFRPTLSRLRSELAEGLRALDRTEEALLEFERATVVAPADVHVHLVLAHELTQHGRHRDAIDVLAKAIERIPTAMELWDRLVELHCSLGEYPEARSVLERLRERFPGKTYPLLATARFFRRAPGFADRAEIERHYQGAIRANARFWDAVWEYALFLCDLGEYDRARAVVSEYVPLAEDPLYARGALATIDRWSGEKQRALDGMRQLIAERPDYQYGWSCCLDWASEDWNTERIRELADSMPASVLEDESMATRRLELLERHGTDPEELDAEWQALCRNHPRSGSIHLAAFDRAFDRGRLDLAVPIIDALAQFPGYEADIIARRVRVAGHERNNVTVLRLALELTKMHARPARNSARIVADVVSKQKLWPSVANETLRLIERGGRVNRWCYARLTDGLEAVEATDALKRLLAALETVRDWETAELVLWTLQSLNESGGARWITTHWLPTHRELVDGDTRLWQVIGRSYSVLGDLDKTIRWLGKWRSRPGVELWSVNNLIAAFYQKRRFSSAATVAAEALEACEHDHAVPWVVENWLRSLLHLQHHAEFSRVLGRYRARLERSDESRDALKTFDAFDEVLSTGDQAGLRRRARRVPPSVQRSGWAPPLWERLLELKLTPWSRFRLLLRL